MKGKTVGYSYWGFLTDTKYDSKGNKLSTPDGNAFYSWSIIFQLLENGYNVLRIMPTRDNFSFVYDVNNPFSAFIKSKRLSAYYISKGINYNDDYTKENVFKLWNEEGLNKCSYIIHEWRMLIPGRNDLQPTDKDFQPDYLLQEYLIEYCAKYNVDLVIFDLDYKLTEKDLVSCKVKGVNYIVIELGNKWENHKEQYKFISKVSKTVNIPFLFSEINYFEYFNFGDFENNLVYIGNRYERDWCIDKYIPTEMKNVKIYGNWLEGGRDSADKWPNLKFGERLQTKDMYNVYSNSVCTILLAKEEYLKYSFMTARILEAIFYGCVPLFISEYGSYTIEKYAGVYAKLLTVENKSDVIDRCYMFKHNTELRASVILYLREKLKFMDVKYFIRDIEKKLFDVKLERALNYDKYR